MKLTVEEMKICKSCGECCNWMTFTMSLPNQDLENYKEYYLARGCLIKNEKNMGTGFTQISVMVYSPCLKSTTFGCKIYPSRPVFCKSYDCRSDPFMQDLSPLTKDSKSGL